ncbi:MAG: amino acid adenylation domain-containing protein [Nostoc indistinguendum CM1-VF10]|jgi:amino acid adenylation domain-containing protein|nr:amino acid adenylation domain-containing protein [Nostoc indistinguendum CM1-VF10]
MQTKTLSGFQLSPQQKRLWLLQQDSSAYLTQCAILLKGDLKPEVLKAALQQVINRHEILRTSFRRLTGVKTPVMVVTDRGSPLWQDIDLSDWDDREHSAKIEELFQEAIRQGFDFDQGSLLRLFLLRLSKNVHILHVCLPALCADTWTIKNLVTEISDSYYDCLKGEKLCDEVVQYLQFSEWQNQLLEDSEAEAAEEYWRQQKLSTLATLRLPFESKSSKRSGFEADCFRLAIAPDVTAKIETLARKYDTSAAVVLLACWQTLIWRLTGQPDIIIGTAFDRREYEELHDVLGLVATWLPIKSHLAPDLCFTEVLELAEKTISDAEEWQDYLVPEPIGNDNTLAFPIGFEFEQLPEGRLAAGMSFSLYKQYSCIEQFKIKLTCTRHNDSLSAAFYYDVNYFCADIIQRLAGQFQTLLASATENSDAAISQLEVLSKSARQQLLVEFNQTQVDYPKDKCIHQLFEKQAERTPNNIAVVFEDQQLTYAELNARANQLAHHLLSLGVGPETIVALCVERSLETFIGLLGILKAGGAYLPLDPLLPTERLVFMLQNAQVSVILTQQHLVEQLSEQAAPVVCLDTDWDVIAQQPNENSPSEATPENLVYVVYTSGSTGKPKGVAIGHQQLLNYLHSILERLDLPVGSSFATLSTFAADLGNTAIFPSLCTGGCLHVISQERATNPEALADYCDRHPIDCLKIVPSHLRALLAASHPEKILPRQRLILGGEVLSWKLVEELQQYKPSCQILNHYGPTEATVGVLIYPIKGEPIRDKSETVPLGRPLANTQVYILDNHLRPVPIGVPGELYIGGAGLAWGYLNRPDLTAERFILNPFSQKTEARLYKTDDLVRYLPDGNIEYLGRIDQQVKIRGFLIDLGEIEAVLGQHPALQEAVVMAREDVPGNKRLVAYVVPHLKSAPTFSDLRRFLKKKLPEYMMPATFVMLQALPLTPNGKVDRRALPAPNTDRPELQEAFVAPRDTLELQLAQIWESVLDVRPIGVTDNFFNLGGHSLLAVRLMAQIHQQFGQNLSLATLFQAATIEQLASTLRKPSGSLPWSPLVKIQPGGSKRPFFCLPGSGGNVLYFYDLARHLGSDQPFYGLQARGLDGEQAPHTQVEDMAVYYLEALQAVQPQGPYLLGGHSFGSFVAFEMALQLQKQGQEVAMLAILDTLAPVPGNKPVEVEKDDAKYLTDIATIIERFFGKNLSVSYDDLQPLEPDEQLNYLLERLKMANILPPEARLPQARGFLQVFKANAQTHYVPKEVYPNRITVFRARKELCDDPAMGWDKVSSEPVETHDVPGDHNTMVAEPHVQVLAEQLRACLDKAQAR